MFEYLGQIQYINLMCIVQSPTCQGNSNENQHTCCYNQTSVQQTSVQSVLVIEELTCMFVQHEVTDRYLYSLANN